MKTCVRSKKAASKGFTMLELIIVVTILAIIVGLAIPSYIEQARKSRRADATGSLLAASQFMERCFTRNNSYSGCNPFSVTTASADGYYTMSFDGAVTASTYKIKATPTGDQVKDPCGAYTLDHLGNRTPVPGSNRCWAKS